MGSENTGSAEDRATLDRCIAGDREAWLSLMKKYGALVAHAARNTLQRVVGSFDSNQVDDAVQAVWLSLCDDDYRRLRSFHSKCSLSTWLTVLTTRRTLDLIRTETRKGSYRNVRLEGEGRDLIQDIVPAKDAQSVGADEIEVLYYALEQLPPDDRLLLKMYYLDGLSYRIIAATLRVAPNTVSSYLLRAREKLKNVLSRPSSP